MGRRFFTREFKLESVKLVRERGVSIAQAARDLGIGQNVLGRCVREARSARLGPPGASTIVCVRAGEPAE